MVFISAMPVDPPTRAWLRREGVAHDDLGASLVSVLLLHLSFYCASACSLGDMLRAETTEIKL